MSEALLPCPHCGDTEGLYPSHRNNGGKPYAIDCIRCGYDFTPREGFDVLEMWNRRFDPTDLTVLVKTQAELADFRLQNEFVSSILKDVMEELGITDECRIAEAIAARQSVAEKLTEALERLTDYSRKPTQADWQAADEALALAKGA